MAKKTPVYMGYKVQTFYFSPNNSLSVDVTFAGPKSITGCSLWATVYSKHGTREILSGLFFEGNKLGNGIREFRAQIAPICQNDDTAIEISLRDKKGRNTVFKDSETGRKVAWKTLEIPRMHDAKLG